MVLQIVPLNTQLRGANRQPCRPLEALARGRIGTDKDTKARLCHKVTITRDAEVLHLAAQLQRPGLDLCFDRANRHHILTAFGLRIDQNLLTRHLQVLPESHAHTVRIEFEARRHATVERQCGTHSLGIRIRPVREAHRKRLAREQRGTARGNKDFSVKLHTTAEVHAEVADPRTNVVQLQNRSEAQIPAVLHLRSSQMEAVVANNEARNYGTIASSPRLQRARQVQLGNCYGRTLQTQNLLCVISRLFRRRHCAVIVRVALRVVLNRDTAGFGLQHVLHVKTHRSHVNSEFPQTAANDRQRRTDVHVHIEQTAQIIDAGAEHAGAAEVQFGVIHTQSNSDRDPRTL